VKSNEFLSGSHDLFLEMKDLAQRQREILSEDRMDLFLDLSAKRDRVQQKISAGQRRYKESFNQHAPPPGANKNRALSEEISRIIKSIQDIDREIETLIYEKRDGLLSDMRGLRHGQKALKGYGGKPLRPPRFIDRKG
jgi:hypothetical protein